MPTAKIPLRFRVPIEYAVIVGINAAFAWVYAAYAGAGFWPALAIGLAAVLGFWLFMQFRPRTRGKGIHIFTAVALAATLFAILRL